MRRLLLVMVLATLAALALGCEDRVVEVKIFPEDADCQDAREFRWYVKKNYPQIWLEYYGGTAIGAVDSVIVALRTNWTLVDSQAICSTTENRVNLRVVTR